MRNTRRKSALIISNENVELWKILEHLPTEVVWLNPSLRCKYANLPFSDVCGLSQPELKGQPVLGALPTEWQLALLPAIENAINGRRSSVEFTTQSSQGVTMHKQAAVLPQPRGEQSSQCDVLILVSDHTESAMMRQALRTSTDALADLKIALDAHAIVAVTDSRGIITSVNDKFCAISQFPRHELIGKTHRIVNSGMHPPAFFRELWTAISSGKIWSGDICNRAKNGSIYWVQTTIVPFLNTSGKPVQYIALRVDVTQRKLLEEESARRASLDDLTGMPNRRLMKQRLQEMKIACSRTGSFGALMFLDLDNFKEVNDTLGHESGDDLLMQVSQRLVTILDDADTVARTGGDEYVIIAGNMGPTEETAANRATALTQEILEEFKRPFYLHHAEVYSSASIGVVLFCDDSISDSEILKHADMALYQSKQRGKNQSSLFDPQLQQRVLERASILSDLRNATANEQFRLFYQPVVDIESKVIGYEALIRWFHPTRGVVMPNDFIPLAEQSGLIVEIGTWVLHNACAQLGRWREGPESAHWTLAVNICVRQIRDPNFFSIVTRLIEQYGIEPSQLRLELTESMFHSRPEQLVEMMAKLKQIGIRFSMDDFGTGYSSLAFLKEMPFDQLKIDRAFVTDLMTHSRGKAIAQIILDLAYALDLHVVAEGVDSIEQFQFLKEHGCQAFQGYFFGRPEPLHDGSMAR
ncbi:hypothetical protein LMG26857_00406 [Achromobacter anxifer]|nr:hypothetical protein LMG26857_00406 [Achromobacter anxifer]